MCRIFGFRSVLNSGVHSSLLSAENALANQSRRHPDGWGLAYYIDEAPHLVKSTDTAETDRLFHRLSAIVRSETVLAHVRKATQGDLTITNTHPFQFGRWTFAHNGNVCDFDDKKNLISDMISAPYRQWPLGQTDSELIFHFFLDRMRQEKLLHQPHIPTLIKVLTQAIYDIIAIIGPVHEQDLGSASENYLSFILTDGKTLIALQGGLTMFYSTYKKSCGEKQTCSHYHTLCESQAKPGDKVNHLIISSEPLQGENIWNRMTPGDLIAVDDQMQLHSSHLVIPVHRHN
jgi:predicted glutamine amidotransferase